MGRARHIVLAAATVALLLISALGASAASASVHSTSAIMPRPDSDAPPGATYHWLPSYQWVMERWMPFDETRLYTVLGVSPSEVYQYLITNDPTHSLDALARAQHVSTTGLAGRIVGPRAPGESVRQWHVLQGRTRLILRQPHLSQHMFFHEFHQTVIDQRLPAIFGVSAAVYARLLHDAHRRLCQIAAVGRVSKQHVLDAVMKIDDAEGAIGVRRGEMPATENAILRARDREKFHAWWQYQIMPGM